MKNIITLVLVCTMLCSVVLASSTKKTIMNNSGYVTGHTRSYSNGRTVQYDKYGSVQYKYKKNSNGTITQYDKYGRVLGTYR